MTPNPQPGPDFVSCESCDEHSKPWCKHRSTCLRIAADADWRSLSCLRCDAYSQLTGEDRAIEIVTLKRFGALAQEFLRPRPPRKRKTKGRDRCRGHRGERRGVKRSARLRALPARCPKVPADCTLVRCRMHVLSEDREDGAIRLGAQGKGVTIPLHRFNSRIVNRRDIERAARLVARRARKELSACTWDLIDANPHGMDLESIGEALGGMTGEMVRLVEERALAKVGGVLLSLGLTAHEWRPETQSEVTWPEPAPRLRRARADTDLNLTPPVTGAAIVKKAA